jgi:hypothetical protein
MASPTFTRVVPSALAALTVALLAAGTALAQQTSNLESPSRPTTFDVVFGAMQSYGGGGVDLRVSGVVPVTERRSIELFAGVSESGRLHGRRHAL